MISAAEVALRRKEEEVAALSQAMAEAGVEPPAEGAAGAAVRAGAAAAEKKGRALKLPSGKAGSKKEALKSLSAELTSSKEHERQFESELDVLLQQLAAASATNEGLEAQLARERQALAQAKEAAAEARGAQQRVEGRLAAKEKEAATLTDQLQALILQKAAASGLASKSSTPRKPAGGLISGFPRG